MHLLTPNSNRLPHIPTPKFVDHSNKIEIEKVINNLPYACIVDIRCPAKIDSVYYAALDSKEEKIFYKSEHPTDLLPSFSIHDLKTEEDRFMFVCWPVTKGKIGEPTKFGPILIRPNLDLGTHELEVDFEGENLTLFHQVKPLIEKHYGKAALAGKVKVEQATYDIYLPSFNSIKLSPNKQNFIHELIHANRKQVLFACHCGKYQETTEMIEEFFAEGIANLVKDDLNKMPNTHLQEGAVYGSTMGYNYDFRIQEPSLKTQNLQSTSGGIIFLETARYYLASEAYHKVALEYWMTTNRYFGKDFNVLYYKELEGKQVEPDKALFFHICSQLMNSIEGLPTIEWLTKQILFDCENVIGDKIYMDFNDYPMHDEWLGICQIHAYETFENGSDWAIGEKRYNKNGSPVIIEVKNVNTNEVIFSKTNYLSDYPNGFGFVKLYFYHKENSPGVAHFSNYEQGRNSPFEVVYTPAGLYEINVTTENATRKYYRLMGETMLLDRDKFVFAYPNMAEPTIIELSHTNKEGKITELPPQLFENKMCIVPVPFIENKNCAPGILNFTLTSKSGIQRKFQRNIGYGGSHGGQQFLITK